MSKETALASLTASIPTAPTGTATIPASPEGAIAPAPKAELDSTRLNHLMKKESELVKQREAYKKEFESFQAEKEKMKEIQTKLNQFEEMKVKDPIKALKLMGFSEADLINFLSGEEDKSTPEEKATKIAQTEIAKFKEEQAKKEQEQVEKRNSELITQFKSDINKTITSDPIKYEFCNHYGAVAEELIYDTVNEVLKESGELITTKEAAELVEEYYEESYKAMNTLKKVSATAAPTTEQQLEQKKEEAKDKFLKPQPAKTLTNKTTATVASTTVFKKETPSEKKARLIQKLYNLGKQ
jgi:hypothetical protein